MFCVRWRQQLQSFCHLQLSSVEVEIKDWRSVSISRSGDDGLVLVEGVETPGDLVIRHLDSNKDVGEVGGTADDVPASALFIFINMVKYVPSKLLRMNMGSNDDIVRYSLFNTGIEMVDTSGNVVCGKQSARTSGKAMPDGQLGQDNEGVHGPLVPSGDHDTGGVAVEEGGRAGQIGGGGGQVGLVPRGQGVVGGKVGSN